MVSGNHSGSSGNFWTPSGISTPGSFRDVQIWIAAEMLGGSSSDPPLMLTVSDPPSDSCQSREPQFGQKAHLTRMAAGEVRGPNGQRERHHEVLVLAVARWLLSGLRRLLLTATNQTCGDPAMDYRS